VCVCIQSVPISNFVANELTKGIQIICTIICIFIRGSELAVPYDMDFNSCLLIIVVIIIDE
jgi:hypothetical protein